MRNLTLPRLILAVAACLLAATAFASFRGEDWLNLEAGVRAFEDPAGTLTRYRFLGFYRPLFDFYVGATFRLFGLHPWPHTLLLLLLCFAHAGLLAWIVRLRRGDRLLALTVAAAFLVQANTYAWTVFWISNSTGSLLATFVLLTIALHHRAVRRAEDGRSHPLDPLLPALAAIVAGTAKEEVLLLPLTLAAFELPRWRRLSPAARRAATASWLAVCAVIVAYVGFRFAVAPPELSSDRGRYSLRLGLHSIRNLAFFALHLLPLPVVALAMARLLLPRRAAEPGADAVAPAGPDPREGVRAGLLWAGVSILLYLPIGGYAFGYLYVPAMAVAFATGHHLHGRIAAAAAGSELPARPIAGAAAMLLPCALLAFSLTGAGFVANGWHRYAAIARDAFATLDATVPEPPAGARFVFLDPFGSEVPAGRSLFNMVFDDAAAAMVRLHYRRPDLEARQIRGPAVADSLVRLPVADAVFLAHRGRLIPLQPAIPTPPKP